ncbi:para-aminobenzoate synthase [Nibribacter ruber]|uniref:Para-aminobenzoate synthase n=1 Tax=Nibribacter ruber TaxID=2698458 RepID=A0A6P1NS11_9BACT|nr:anthranilate synthase component I family protein [Nibribacter ruber]QHL86457.1 para-aminobenzoate synthase [Nibribacter ruber]
MPHLSLSFQDLPVSPLQWKQQALAWANEYHEVVAYYEPNQISCLHGSFQNLLGIRKKAFGSLVEGIATKWEDLQELKDQSSAVPLMGFLTYDLKNQIEELTSKHPDHVGFPELFFFQPEVWLEWLEDSVTIHSVKENPLKIAQAIHSFPFLASFPENSLKTKPRVQKEMYLQTVEKLRNHILEGDVYEVNYCQEFYAQEAVINPLATFWQLNAASPTPFAGFLKLEHSFLLCASPERFLKKEGSLLISQPIKGTIQRGVTQELDQDNKQALASSEKERAENMMIVDLVRNDLNRICNKGTVQVEELFGLYGFRYVWQMISTIIGNVDSAVPVMDILKATFPMGSMTGAPKVKALELIEEYEQTRRGLYSGSLGYFLPNGDFDFNVVIRSIQYNVQSQYLSFEVGSAVTYDSDPEQEYQECLLKAAAITRVLEQK